MKKMGEKIIYRQKYTDRYSEKQKYTDRQTDGDGEGGKSLGGWLEVECERNGEGEDSGRREQGKRENEGAINAEVIGKEKTRI